ncbi:helix-turn-helix transcriptional regulator [Plastoroseomonas hellenica]|uniref:helix-turn-helix transcriptional regulator n=1 Tax=Plastoroseomonas hellenica TaxID=2687306 RepID=UPI001BA5269E|nr:YafY family protein [Plastoroseomonas hellenica]MBR0647825.1 YafY family transcriptional regulator [Plastoroseomonas hellenica]
MRRAGRLFDIIQALRIAPRPITAATLAEQLEVAVRTVYRDIATLQARRIPIEGAAGIGYVLRRGFDLPPLMFTADEIDAIAVGARLVRRLRDPGLQDAADAVLAKITTILPDRLRSGVAAAPFFVSDGSAAVPEGIDLSDVRRAIRETRKIRITYADAEGRRSHRTVWPIAMLYYVDVTLLGAWCELRRDYRHFRVERILTSTLLEEVFPTAGGKLLEGWFALQRSRVADGKLSG